MAFESPVDFKHKSKIPQYGTRYTGSGQTGRDKPLFTAMRRPQFQQEFTTESLNNTAIGSPSPARPLNGASNKLDRPAHGAGLSAAFRRVDEQSKNEENKERSGTNVKRPNIPYVRPTITRQYVSEAPNPSPKVLPPRGRTRTPSPPQVRHADLMLSPMSEVSEASPPREFAEAYKQINDEEDLAAQEEEFDVTEDTDEILIDGDSLQPGLQLSRRSSRRRSPGVDDAIIFDSPEKELIEATQDSMPSLPSDLELEVAQSSRHKKDLQRLDLALGDRKAFSKAKRRPRPTAGNLQREDASSRSGSRSENSNTSGSILSDGSLNIPQTWGRKARSGRTWLSRLDRDRTGSENVAPAKGTEAEEKGVNGNAVQDWQAEASMTPLPPAQDLDSLEHSPSPAPTKPSSLTARDRVRKLAFGDDGFLATSQGEAISRAKSSALDLIREREIQHLAKSAVTTNRLGELKEKRSLERVGHRSPSFGSDHDQANGGKLENEPVIKPRLSQTILRPVIEEAPSDAVKTSSDNKSVSGFRSDCPPDQSKISSLHFTSEAPAPVLNQPIKTTYADSHSNDEKPSDLQTPAPIKSAKLQAYLKTPLVTGAWIDTPLPVSKAEPMKEDLSEEDSKEALQQRTGNPIIEQPAVGSKGAPTTKIYVHNLQETAPKLPGSALAAIITRAKDKKAQGVPVQGEDTLLLDDSTILSLEEFIASGEQSDSSSLEPGGHDRLQSRTSTRSRKHRLPASRRLSQNSASDSEADIGLTTRLDRLRHSIQDAKTGVGSLQKKISKLPHKESSASSSRAPSLSRPQSECEEAGEFHDFIWPCDKCGRKAGSSIWTGDDASLLDWHWRPLQIYMPKLWFWPADGSVPHLTRPGWWTALCLILCFTELILHNIYSPPFYASQMRGYGVDLYTPRPPFVLPKLIWRDVLSSPLDTLQSLLQMIIRFFAGVLGISAGIFAPPGDSADLASVNMKWSYHPGVISQNQADAIGMDADELL